MKQVRQRSACRGYCSLTNGLIEDVVSVLEQPGRRMLCFLYKCSLQLEVEAEGIGLGLPSS
jgi:hypothetical protein